MIRCIYSNETYFSFQLKKVVFQKLETQSSKTIFTLVMHASELLFQLSHVNYKKNSSFCLPTPKTGAPVVYLEVLINCRCPQ